MGVYISVVYFITPQFGAAAQAGFGVAGRVMQSIFLPVIAISFAVAPIVGQNFGARKPDRIRATFKDAALIISGLMLALTIFCHFAAHVLMLPFTKDPAVIDPGATFLSIISLNFVAQGLIFTTSSVFQGLGNTFPPLGASSLRLLLFAIPAYLWSLRPGFRMDYMWYLSVASVLVQMTVNLFMLRREFRRKLQPLNAASIATA
jgi:Na+-driven multidrug efflux pump